MGDLINFGATLSGVGSAETPDARNLGSEMDSIGRKAGKVYNSENTWSPQYAALALKNLGIVIPGATDTLNAANTSTRTSLVNDLGLLTPQLKQAYYSANPEGQDLLKQLTLSAGTGLAA